jgi:hypothetical protein
MKSPHPNKENECWLTSCHSKAKIEVAGHWFCKIHGERILKQQKELEEKNGK